VRINLANIFNPAPGMTRQRILYAGIFLACFASAAIAGPGRISGVTDFSAVQSDNNGQAQDTFRREASVNWLHNPTSVLSLRSGMRYYRFDIANDLQDDDWREDNQVSGGLNWQPEYFDFASALQRRDARSRTATGGLITNNATFSLSTRSLGAPIYSLKYLWQHIHDDVADRDRDTYDSNLQGAVDWSDERRMVSYGISRRENENIISGIKSIQISQNLRTNYNNQADVDKRLKYSIGYTLNRTSLEDELVGAAAVLEGVPVSAGLSAETVNPETGVLEDNPGLIDNDVESPTDPLIDIGGALDDRNIGVDLGFPRLSDTVYLYVDREPGSGIEWSIWISEDNLSWVEWAPVPLTTYNVGLGRFEIQYPSVEFRYVKAVKSGLAGTTQLLVTEMEVYRELPSNFKGSRRERSTHMGNLRLNYDLDENYDIQLDASGRNESSGDLYDDRSNLDYSLKLKNRLTPKVEQIFTWEQALQRGSQDSQDIDGNNLRYSLSTRPLTNLYGALSANRRWSWVGGDADRILTSVSGELRGNPRNTVELMMTGGWTQSVLKINDTRNRSLRGRVAADMDLRPNISLDLGYGHQYTMIDPQSERHDRRTWQIAATWRPTMSINLRGSLNVARDRFDSETGSFNVDWRLTPKLSTGLFVGWTSTGRDTGTDRLSAHLNYDLGHRGTAYLRYSEVDFQEAGGRETASWQQGLRFSF
jgi:hypothetical protein